jgi:filamentous hemagglutinin
MKQSGEIEAEFDLLQRIRDHGFPTIKAQAVQVDGQPGILMEQFALNSKAIVDLRRLRPQIVGDSPFLNARTVADLKRVRELNDGGFVILDLQFLIGKDGRLVVADPKRILSRGNPFWYPVKAYNNGVIDRLIEQASHHIK